MSGHQGQRGCKAGGCGRMRAQRHLHSTRLRMAERAPGVKLQRSPMRLCWHTLQSRLPSFCQARKPTDNILLFGVLNLYYCVSARLS